MKLARRCRVIDHPDERRVHTTPTPRGGGLAIYFAFVASTILTVAWHPSIGFDSQVLGVLIGSSVIAIAGLLDDKYDMSPAIQTLAIVAGATVLILFGVKIAYISDGAGGLLWLRWVSIPVTLIWVFGLTKTVDLMDGIDGLAAGICAIAAATLLIMTFRTLNFSWETERAFAGHHKQLIHAFVTVRIFCAALLGASIGFLRFNYPPAKVFMGTIGAWFMGFVIASASVIGAFKVVAFVAIAVPMLIFALPILDTTFVIAKRALSGKKMSGADKSHVHHRLLDRGFTQRQAIWVIYLVTAAFSAVGLMMFWYGR